MKLGDNLNVASLPKCATLLEEVQGQIRIPTVDQGKILIRGTFSIIKIVSFHTARHVITANCLFVDAVGLNAPHPWAWQVRFNG